jgi:hypothetical protein
MSGDLAVRCWTYALAVPCQAAPLPGRGVHPEVAKRAAGPPKIRDRAGAPAAM